MTANNSINEYNMNSYIDWDEKQMINQETIGMDIEMNYNNQSCADDDEKQIYYSKTNMSTIGENTRNPMLQYDHNVTVLKYN